VSAVFRGEKKRASNPRGTQMEREERKKKKSGSEEKKPGSTTGWNWGGKIRKRQGENSSQGRKKKKSLRKGTSTGKKREPH